MTPISIPLFPLYTVLFPDGSIPLRVFEPRYVDMISACLKQGQGFGVCLIREGTEIGLAATTATTYEVGIIANIYDWQMRPGGILGVTVKGEQRFRIVSEQVQDNQLLIANVEILPDESYCQVTQQYLPLVEALQEIIAQIDTKYNSDFLRYDDASWVGFRLAELLPLRLSQKQYFLQLNGAMIRLERLADVMMRLHIQV